MAPPKKERQFDVAKLQNMQEPLTLRVDRVTGNAKSPIPLPSRDGAPSGTNWDIPSILEVEQWILREAGGGSFEASVVDAKGESMTWAFFWDPRSYDPKIPSTIAESMMQQPIAPGGTRMLPPFPTTSTGWPPQQMPAAAPMMPMQPYQYQGGYPAYPYQPAPYYPLPPAPPRQGYGYSQGPVPDPLASENRQLLNELQRQREEKQAAEHRAELERIQQAHSAQLAEQNRNFQTQMQALQQQIQQTSAAARTAEADRVRELERQQAQAAIDAKFQAMQESLARLTEAIATPKQTGEDPALVALRDQIRRQEENAARERDAAALREQLRANEENTRRMVEAAAANRQDPLVAIMQESSRNQMQQSQQLMQLQQAQITAMQQSQVHPLQMFQMVKEASSGTDAVLKSTVGVYNDLFGTARTMFSEMARMAGGEPEHPAIRIAEQIGGSVSKMAERYISGQQSKEISQAKAQQEQAKAYAQYIAAQQQQQMAQQQPIPQPASTAQPAGELNGANGAAQPAAAVATAQAETAAKADKPESQGAKVIQLRRHGKSDAEWFGPALSDVERLRKAAADFIEGLKNGKEEGVNPEQATTFIAQGITHAMANKIEIKAFTLLFQQERYADFIDVLLPELPQAYRDDCVKHLIEIVEGSEDDDEDVDEDGDDGQDADADDAS